VALEGESSSAVHLPLDHLRLGGYALRAKRRNLGRPGVVRVVLVHIPVSSNRTRAASFGGTSSTRSPAATSCRASVLGRVDHDPARPPGGTARLRGGMVQRHRRAAWPWVVSGAGRISRRSRCTLHGRRTPSRMLCAADGGLRRPHLHLRRGTEWVVVLCWHKPSKACAGSSVVITTSPATVPRAACQRTPCRSVLTCRQVLSMPH
jgi:hypothetical protein